ncbi:hypothetical protein GE21DRAFT_1815 [Neurospora crassa]|uniref:Uncharacterized protein n=1 Tax=Neurospora crassa (strain ATCC 24698 / 74-OR23-1A / CBS 708.71 / DSM 1257 / FGSC 987) TaxID=367110 RepID=Q7SFE4_NEUCR|nr:hypothetical protein NCU00887 [Neurospora crassa OR74A]EAA35567.1 hypothetical protein NCU00887 [Neurospora crassa OR74A]KHE82209.1 hypothetical protein GE21DRAFT_1815 [Neurospora crassa]|eukprot:XP_964803.1 hypothetical protein NCU00887 [Neurospora crassa OR74A]
MDIPQQQKVQQQVPTMEEVQNIIKLQRSIVMADILKVKPEMSDPEKYNAALKEATALALYNIYHAKRDRKVKTEAFVGWYISNFLWMMFHGGVDPKKNPIRHLEPIDFPGEPESLAYECYMLGRRNRDEEAQDNQQQVAASDREDANDAAQPYVKVNVDQSTEYLITVEVDGGREVAHPLYRNIAQCVKDFGQGSHYVRKRPGPSYKKKVERPAPVQQTSSRPAKRARY